MSDLNEKLLTFVRKVAALRYSAHIDARGEPTTAAVPLHILNEANELAGSVPDPDLLMAREICADLMISWDKRKEGMAYRDGAYDLTTPVVFAAAAIRNARRGTAKPDHVENAQ